jgi:uncharacterized phage protein (predicted DNA packaging)
MGGFSVHPLKGDIMIIDTEEAKTWLRIDNNEEDALIDLLIGAAEEYLKNATGKIISPPVSNQARLFCLVLVTDWYENRELIGTKPSEKVRHSIQSMLTQLIYCGDVV